MSGLKVVCLISGGKDSLFSILHCLENGHEVVALANLHPQINESLVDDLDSYMYQTVGHTVIPLYGQALGLPMYRQPIFGSAVNQSKSYGPANAVEPELEDETEALVPLLQRVKETHPEVNAVSTGAILSDYQRTRVESVALRLRLTPLSYLWQWPNLPPHSQASLLEDMAAVSQDSRIIKVASGGLDDSFLWQNVADARTISRLDRASKRFGSADDGAVLGEGGEYETLAVAGPPPIWKGRIVVDDDKRNVIAGEAGSASVQVLEARVESVKDVSEPLLHVRRPALLEPRFQSIKDALVADTIEPAAALVNSGPDKDSEPSKDRIGTRNDCNATSRIAGQLLLPNLVGEGSSAAEQIRSIMEQAKESFQRLRRCLADVVYTSIILRDMKDFASINAVYGTYFQRPNPPARVTIACAKVLPTDKALMVSLTSVEGAGTGTTRGLHVQSQSYWAPANIGPYSQAISVPVESDMADGENGLVYISGQIPLIPASMELPPLLDETTTQNFALQAALAQQHFERIGRAMQVQHWLCTIAFITANSIEESHARAMIARKTWNAFYVPAETSDEMQPNDEDETFDIWDVKLGANRIPQNRSHPSAATTVKGLQSDVEPPSLYVIRVDSLPRGAGIEWVTYGLRSDGTAPENHHFQHLLHTFKENIM